MELTVPLPSCCRAEQRVRGMLESKCWTDRDLKGGTGSMVDVTKTGQQTVDQVTRVKATKGQQAPKDSPVPGPGGKPVEDAIAITTGRPWNPKVKFQTDPWDKILKMDDKGIKDNHVGLRDFFKQDDITHLSRVYRRQIGPAQEKGLGELKPGNVSAYKYDWKDGKQILTVDNKATFKDLQKAIAEKGHLIRQDFDFAFKVHHGAAKGGETEFHKVAMSTFHDWSGRVIYSLDHLKPDAQGIWARLRQEILDKGGRIVKHVKF